MQNSRSYNLGVVLKAGFYALFLLHPILTVTSCVSDDYTIEAANPTPESFTEVNWVSNYGGSSDDVPTALSATSDGGL